MVPLSGCLVTGSPDFSPPERTRPELLTSGPNPPSPALGEFTFFVKAANGEYPPVEFAAYVVSEDAGEEVQPVLLLDYGYDETSNDYGPFRAAFPGEALPAASRSDGPRRVSLSWQPRADDPVGCHSVSLMVTHAFKRQFPVFYCPAESDDASIVTWFVAVCGSDAPQVCDYDNCRGTADERADCEGLAP